ncbi:zinc ribbon domain-containing protein [Chloroflexota bacterium]
MPIYEYECRRCGHRFEMRRGIADSDSELGCPECGEEGPRRLFSTFATASGGGGGGECSPSEAGAGPPPAGGG